MRSFQIGRVIVGPAVIVALVTGVVLGMALTTYRAEAQAARTFSGGTAMMLNYIKPEATDDFEAVMTKLGEALQASDNSERGQQAAGWKIYRAARGRAQQLYPVCLVHRPGRARRRLRRVSDPERGVPDRSPGPLRDLQHVVRGWPVDGQPRPRRRLLEPGVSWLAGHLVTRRRQAGFDLSTQ